MHTVKAMLSSRVIPSENTVAEIKGIQDPDMYVLIFCLFFLLAQHEVWIY